VIHILHVLPDAASLEGFSLAELRDVVGRLVGEVRRLHLDNAALQAGVDAQQATIVALRIENQALRDEVARLKGLPPRPPSRPSGMEQATQPGAADMNAKRSKPPRGVKRDRDAVTAERVCKAAVPAGSRFKGYEDILVRDLHLSAEVIRYRRERWLLPLGETVLADLPAGIVGGFGPELRRFVLALHAQGQVTTERLTALLNGIGVEISKRQIVRLLAEPLDDFVAEDQEVLRAGLATAQWVTVDPRKSHAISLTPPRGMRARTGSRRRSATPAKSHAICAASRCSGPARRSRAKRSCRCCGQGTPTTS